MERKGLLVVTMLTALSVGVTAEGGPPELPPFLPDYYAAALTWEGRPLELLSDARTSGGERWEYGKGDRSLKLSIEFIDTDDSQNEIALRGLLGFLDAQINAHRGRFDLVTGDEIHAVVSEPIVDRHCFAFRLPRSVQVWTYSTAAELPDGQFEAIRALVNRQRYEEASEADNVSMGAWGDHLYAHACDLLEAGHKEQAVEVLERLLSTSPFHYRAHLDLMVHADDPHTAAQSAKVVLDNAEDPNLIRQAAEYLGLEPKTYESVPYLGSLETGLQVVLIPLPPCNIRLLEDTAKVYQEITDVPVKVRRLRTEWNWSRPERVAHQRALEAVLTERLGETEFTGWAREEYAHGIRAAVAEEGALAQYFGDRMIAEMENRPGQYRMNAYAHRLCRTLMTYRSDDVRTMYVGVTQANLYSGDNNYLFSMAWKVGDSRASLLSYHMLQGETSGAKYESRPRLAERLAKELVPASLKLLDIPRSTDPRCPYSYSDGIGRVDEKTLELSEPVVAALEEFRNQPDGDVVASAHPNLAILVLMFGWIPFPVLWLAWGFLKGRRLEAVPTERIDSPTSTDPEDGTAGR